MSLDYFKKFKRGVDFMDGAEKADLEDLCTGEMFHIADVAFLPGENSEYAVFTVSEKKDVFYFGNTVVTEILKEVQADGMIEEIPNIGVAFEKTTSKKNRDYIAMRFVF